MDLQFSTLLVEILGLLFVVISVFYLAKQLMHGNRLASAESMSDSVQLYLEQYNKSFGSVGKAVFMRKALNDYSSLNQDEKALLFLIMIGHVGAWDNLRTKYEAGFLPEGIYNSITIAFASLLQSPGGFACVEQIDREFGLPTYVMDKTIVKKIVGIEIKPFVQCVDFMKKAE